VACCSTEADVQALVKWLLDNGGDQFRVCSSPGDGGLIVDVSKLRTAA
jgi:hypothetical protein